MTKTSATKKPRIRLRIDANKKGEFRVEAVARNAAVVARSGWATKRRAVQTAEKLAAGSYKPSVTRRKKDDTGRAVVSASNGTVMLTGARYVQPRHAEKMADLLAAGGHTLDLEN